MEYFKSKPSSKFQLMLEKGLSDFEIDFEIKLLTLFFLVRPYGIFKQKFQFQFKKGSSKKFPMSVTTMSLKD